MLLPSTNPIVNPGWATKVGIGIEPGGIPGQAVKSARLVPFTGFDPGKSGAKRTPRKTITGFAGQKGTTKGDAEYPIKVDFEITPEGCDEIFCLYGGAPTTADVAAPDAPGQPTGTVVGTPGVVSGSYTIVASNPQGDSAASTARALTTLNASLTTVNYVNLTWAAVPGATYYKIIKGSNLIGMTQGLFFNDTGQTGSAYSAPSDPTGNQQLWTLSNNSLTATLAVLWGDNNDTTKLLSIYAGCRGDKLSIKFTKKGGAALSASADMRGVYDNWGLTQSAVGLDTATMDVLDAFAEAYAVAMIGGEIASCTEFTAALDRALSDKTILSGYGGPITHSPGPSAHKVTLTLEFDSDKQHRRYFAAAAASGSYSEQLGIVIFPVQVMVANPVNAGGIVNQFHIYCGYAAFDTLGQAIKGKDSIMQDIDIIPYIDPNTGNDVAWGLVNSRTNGSIVTPGTLIQGFNGGAMNPYSN